MPGITREDLARLLRESAGEEEGIELAGDTLDTDFLELGYDFPALLQVSGRLRREYGIALSDDAIADALTPRALLDLVNEAGGRAAAA